MSEQTIHQRNATGILFALRHTGKHVYQGTVTAGTKAKRRAKDKRARHARRLAR